MVIPIAEIYEAVQAEGNHRTPAVFVRVWGCNLRCSFNKEEGVQGRCDTPYAVFRGEKEQLFDGDVVKRILELKHRHVVFTGGEPLLYQEGIRNIISTLPTDYFYEVETNGTLELVGFISRWVDQFNISVKLSSSNQWKGFDNKRINNKALELFPKAKSIFKFVVTSEDDMKEIKEIESIRPDIPIYLMPQGETKEQVLNNIKSTMDLALENGYGFTNRDHILAYGDERAR